MLVSRVWKHGSFNLCLHADADRPFPTHALRPFSVQTSGQSYTRHNGQVHPGSHIINTALWLVWYSTVSSPESSALQYFCILVERYQPLSVPRGRQRVPVEQEQSGAHCLTPSSSCQCMQLAFWMIFLLRPLCCCHLDRRYPLLAPPQTRCFGSLSGAQCSAVSGPDALMMVSRMA